MLHPLPPHAVIGNVPPTQFTNPFCYTPHPLCVAAAEEVKRYLRSQAAWQEEIERGKMFGVLVVEGGFLAAFSGLLDGQNRLPYFVPPIYDLLQPDGHFQREQALISAINHDLDALQDRGNADTFPELYSRQERMYIAALKRERKERSVALQDWLFEQYVCLNARGEEKTMIQVFMDFYREHMLHIQHFERNLQTHHIPSGSGECCAPKLLQYAFGHGLRPLCMAEFWMGQSPRDEVRHEGSFYPACRRKCRPILHFMLQGLDVEESRLERYNAELLKQIDIVYEDDDLLAINKPSGLLSVPSRESQCCVVDWLQHRHRVNGFPPTPVHRLDQDTSGLLLIAKSREALSRLSKQFVQHQVRKSYVALLDGCPGSSLPAEGCVRLPLRPSPYDPPRQMVDPEHGKQAITRYRIVGSDGETTRIFFFPETGRTHQLRMHSAHPDGLGCPIVGDPLYGRTSGSEPLSCHYALHSPRLMLHASSIDFLQPTTGQPIHLDCPPPF